MIISYKEYCEISVKNTPQRYFDFLYRKISHPVTYVFLRMGATPNFLSMLSVVLNIPALILVFSGYVVTGFFVFLVAYIFDFCDGNAARTFIKKIGMSDQDKKFGLLIENFNTNFSLLCLFLALGWYFAQSTGDMKWFAFAFVVFGIKMVMRYSAHQSSGLAAASVKSQSVEQVSVSSKKSFTGSMKEQVKFLLRKSLFSFNFYHAVYLIAFIFFPSFAGIVFLVYGGADVFISLVRIYRSFKIV